MLELQEWRHISVNCPSGNILMVDKKSTTPAEHTLPKLYMMGQVEGHTTRFLLDSAADHSLISVSFVKTAWSIWEDHAPENLNHTSERCSWQDCETAGDQTCMPSPWRRDSD